MATIKDIATLAGVSHGTVSNVLNKRGNVSVEKINLVEEAAKALGYKINVQAQQLRQGSTKRVCVLLPKIGLSCYADLFEAMSKILEESDYDVDVYYTNNLAHYEEKLLLKAVSSNPAAVVVVSSFLKNTGVFNQDTPIIFVDRKVQAAPKNSLYVSFDFELAGREMAVQCTRDGGRNVAIFCGSDKYSNYALFASGAAGVLTEKGCRYKVFSVDDSVTWKAAFEIASDQYEFDSVLTSGLENARYLNQVYLYDKAKKRPCIYALASKGADMDDSIIRYELNYKLCGRRIARCIMDCYERGKVGESVIRMKKDGFYLPVSRKEEKSEETLTFLALKSPTSHAISLLLPDFANRTGIQVKMIEMEYRELYASANDSEFSSAFDLIRLDMVWLKELSRKILLPFEEGSPEVQDIMKAFSPNIPQDYFKDRGKVYAMPFDCSVQLLYYRKDLFEDALIRRKFYEQNKRQLEIPLNFEEYHEVARFFTKRFNPDSPTQYGAPLVFGSAIVAACDFLPRLKAENGTIFSEDGSIQVCTPIIKKTLQKYMEANAYSNQVTNMWWQNSMQAFAKGEAAMNIVFSNHASSMMNDENSQVIGKIGFADIPGGEPMLGGGVIGICKNTRKQEACMEFLKWIYEERISAMITRLGGYINHSHLLNNVDILELYPWIEGMEQAFGIGWRREIDRKSEHFDEYKFEEILGYAIRAVAIGILSIEDALEEAQHKCDVIFNGARISK